MKPKIEVIRTVGPEFDREFVEELQFYCSKWQFLPKGGLDKRIEQDTFYDVTDALDMQNMEKIETRYREKKGVENKGTFGISHITHLLTLITNAPNFH